MLRQVFRPKAQFLGLQKTTAASGIEEEQNSSEKEPNEVDCVAIENDERKNKEQDEQQDLWLKLCSNKDPNDNTVYPDAYSEKDPWDNKEDTPSSKGLHNITDQ